ncbi:alcohol dehydrogenase catalytic domain-containing protein [Virgibacillus dakarensis]|uniref:alcohol dehydrogenase catalytic domain-containing protein n=1 Tax=Virgibacillus dakarensis TaxID=1917889 RepID=UPI000B42E577|nr:alcohol dehydrogenase catalytic domain-containing protein [Virgibacillus dakarensis]
MNEETVESKTYRLVKPGKFEETILHHNVKDGEVVVQPSLASICHADLRYYTGQRRKEALEKKLPMALFHEGIGQVVKSRDESIQTGQRVIIVPNIAGRLLNDNKNNDTASATRRIVADNYSENGAFLGSGYDGIGQNRLVLPSENVVPIPEDVPDKIAVLAEMSSVSLHALSHVCASLNDGKVSVFGDGPVGYLTAALLYHIYGIPKSELIVFGAIKDKLKHFNFATTHLVHDFDFKAQKEVVTAIEGTGGKFSESAINQAIDLIEPQGKITLMGVSEDLVPINTRDVLQKGLTLFGSSRSTVKEFKILMKAFQNQAYQKTLERILPAQNELIRSAEDLKKAMDKASTNKGWGKILLSFEWD